MARRARKSKSSIRVDMSDVGEAFKADEEYEVRVDECTLEEGQKAPYFKLKLKGVGDHEKSTMYHNASTSEDSLWRLRPLCEAFGIDVPDGPMDLDAEDFVGKHAMCSTFKDSYQGGSSIKPDEFWPIDGEPSTGDDDGDEIDLDEIDDADIKKLAKALGVKGRGADALRKKIADLDEDDIREAAEELDIDLAGEEEEKPAPKGRGKKSKKKAAGVSSEEIGEMNEDELDDLVDTHELDIDLDDFKTLRKKRNAVVDAMEEADLLED